MFDQVLAFYQGQNSLMQEGIVVAVKTQGNKDTDVECYGSHGRRLYSPHMVCDIIKTIDPYVFDKIHLVSPIFLLSYPLSLVDFRY